MELIKIQNGSTGKNKHELYYPIFDKSLRIKRLINRKIIQIP